MDSSILDSEKKIKTKKDNMATAVVPEAVATVEQDFDSTIPSIELAAPSAPFEIDASIEQDVSTIEPMAPPPAAAAQAPTANAFLLPSDFDQGPMDELTGIPTVQLDPLVAMVHYNDDDENQKSKGYLSDSRPEYISVSVCKPSQNFAVGLTVKDAEDRKVRVSKIPPTSLLIESPIEINDEIVQINGVDCRGEAAEFACNLIKSATRVVTLVVRNPRHDCNTNVAWNHIVKPVTTAAVGVKIVGNGGDIRVKGVSADNLLEHALLNIGDRVLSINDTDCCEQAMDSQLATMLIRTSEGGVLIVTPTISAASRAGYISATVHKQGRVPELGLGMEMINNKLVVASIVPFSQLCDSPIMVGDKILSINNSDCTDSIMSASHMIAQCVGPVTVAVKVDHGNPSLVCAMIEKPHPDARVGISIALRNNDLVVTNIAPSGLVVNSLLSVGDRLESINDEDCSRMSIQEALAAIGSANRTLTFVARRTSSTAMVVASSSQMSSMTRSEVVAQPCCTIL